MKMTAALMEKLLRLAEGNALPSSSLRGDMFERMQADGILVAITHGSRKSLRVCDLGVFREYLADVYDIRDLEATHELLRQGGVERATQVELTGDSKFAPSRTFTGFLVNSYQPIDAVLAGRAISIFPPEGSFVFIADYQHFSIPEDVTVIGMENAENFRHVERQRHLFSQYEKALFVSRYPQNQSKDLLAWLSLIPNRYVHFGDFDLAGINIFLSEFHRHLGGRGSFLIPSDIEQRLANGSRKRYDDQYAKFHDLHCDIPELQALIHLIHQHHRGYDQEGYIDK